MERKELMCPASPRWEQFIVRLDGPKGLNWRQEKPGCLESLTSDCKGNKDLAVEIMQDMGEIDIGASLALFEWCGGFCDCEISFNVEDSYLSKANAH
jgi:hypothetical protein